MKNIKYFATFGSSQLKDFDVDPMTVMVYIAGSNEEELRTRLRAKPFNNDYCTSYPINRAIEMPKSKLISLDELLRLHN